MTAEQLQRGHERAWKQAYSLPSIARRLLTGARRSAPHAGGQPGLPLLRAQPARASTPATGSSGTSRRRRPRRPPRRRWWSRRAPPSSAPRRRRRGTGGRVRLTLIQPCIGRRPARSTCGPGRWSRCRSAMLAGLTPPDVELRVADDRIEPIPYDEPDRPGGHHRRDLHGAARLPDRQRVPAARRAGGHGRLPRHAAPDEVARYAESVVVGEAEALWPEVVDDWRHGTRQEGLPRRRPGRGSAGPAPTAPSTGASPTCRSGWSRRGAAAPTTASSAPSTRPTASPARRARWTRWWRTCWRRRGSARWSSSWTTTSPATRPPGRAPGGAGPPPPPLGDPVLDPGGARRRLGVAPGGGRLRRRAHRLREPRPGGAEGHGQGLQHPRPLPAGGGHAAPPPHRRLRHLRARLRRRRPGHARRGRGLRAGGVLLPGRLHASSRSRARRSTRGWRPRAGCSTSAGGSTPNTASAGPTTGPSA